MQVTFFKFSKRRNSTATPSTGGDEKTVTLKNGCSFLSPTFLLSENTFDYNYCLFNGRYYWVTDITSVRNNLFEVQCSVDVLGSWKNDILQVSAYIAYSSSDYNLSLTDNRLPVEMESTRVFRASIITRNFNTVGSYLLGVINNIGGVQVKQGFTTIYHVDSGMISEIADKFATEDCLQGLMQTFASPMDAIVFCKWCPIQTGISVFEGPVLIGTYDTGLHADILATRYLSVDVDVTIPWQTSDFRSIEPYAHGCLYLPGVGVVPLSLSDIRGLDSLRVRVVIDVTTNAISYSVSAPPGSFQYGYYIATYSGIINQDIPVASIQSNWQGILSGLGDIAQNIVSGNPLGTVLGIAESTVAAMQTSPRGSGGFSSGSAIDLGTEIMCIITQHSTPMAPSDYRDFMGNVCGRVRQINGLSGYCQTDGFQVSGDMTETEKTEINSMMDGGVYIE